MKKTFSNQLLCVFYSLFLIAGCAKDDSGVGSGSSFNHKVATTIAGRLVDETGNPLAGALVSIENLTATSDLMGLFVFRDIQVNSKRCVLTITKPGFIDQLYGCKPSRGKITYVKPVMMSHELSQNIDAATGGTVSLPGGGSVQFPVNAFVNNAGAVYNGAVAVKMYLLNPDDSGLSSKIPGRDLRAKDAAGNDKVLYTYGMMNIELYGQSSEKLQLDPSKTATLTFPITISQQLSAPSSIPLWYLDATTAIWKEEGTALRSGNQYTAEVNHFTWWNCDYPYTLASIEGDVIGCNGVPVANTDVYADYSAAFVTDNMGHYSGDAPAGYGYLEIYSGDWGLLISQTEIIPNLSTGQHFMVPDLVLGSSSNFYVTVTGELVDCNGNPSDGLVTFSIPGTGFYDYVYVIGGSYSINLDNNTTYEITAVNNALYGQVTFNCNATNPCAGITAIPDIEICDVITSGPTNLTTIISSPLFGTQTLSYYVTNCEVALTPSPEIVLSAVDSVNNSTGNLSLKITNYQIGNSIWNTSTAGLVFTATLNGFPVTMTSEPGGVTTLTSAPGVGGMLNVSYNGNVIITSPQYPGPVPASITGYFYVVRDN